MLPRKKRGMQANDVPQKNAGCRQILNEKDKRNDE